MNQNNIYMRIFLQAIESLLSLKTEYIRAFGEEVQGVKVIIGATSLA